MDKTQIFIEKARIKHGNRYDYNLVEYINTRKKVKIICSIHGVFEQAPECHLLGYNCRKCAFVQQREKVCHTTEIFIQRATEKHNNKYDYSLVEYITARKKVKIICPVHGLFEQTPDIHLNSIAGCKQCGTLIVVQKQKGAKRSLKNQTQRKRIYTEKQKLYNKKHYEKNKEHKKKIVKEYVELNKDFIKQRNSEIFKEKYHNDVNFKLRSLLRSRITHVIKNNIKCAKSMELIGCDIDFVRAHLESQFKPGMSWENHGLYGWQIDHIRPCISFDFSDPDQQKMCFNYKNLQPLWWYENLTKSDKYEIN
jgi:hypothetical protein